MKPIPPRARSKPPAVPCLPRRAHLPLCSPALPPPGASQSRYGPFPCCGSPPSVITSLTSCKSAIILFSFPSPSPPFLRPLLGHFGVICLTPAFSAVGVTNFHWFLTLNESLGAPHSGHLKPSPKNFSSRPLATKSVNLHDSHSAMMPPLPTPLADAD